AICFYRLKSYQYVHKSKTAVPLQLKTIFKQQHLKHHPINPYRAFPAFNDITPSENEYFIFFNSHKMNPSTKLFTFFRLYFLDIQNCYSYSSVVKMLYPKRSKPKKYE
ncbi:MAG: hypothetical protein WBK44_09190, partial [Smithellaceae bacterium]